MPKAFEQCEAAGGKVITKKLSLTRYVHGCTLDGKKYVWGYVKTKKMKTSKKT